MNKAQILRALTSRRSGHMDEALGFIKLDKELERFANECLLNFIRASLHDKKATIYDLPKVKFSPELMNFNEHSDSERFEFSEISHAGTREVINFYGGIAANYFDKLSYLKAIQQVHDRDSLININRSHFGAIEAGFRRLSEQLAAFSEGQHLWVTSLLKHFDSIIYGIDFGEGDYSALEATLFYDDFFAFTLSKPSGMYFISAQNDAVISLPRLIWGSEYGIELQKKEESGVVFKLPDSPLKIYNGCFLLESKMDGSYENTPLVEAEWTRYLDLKSKGTKAYKASNYEQALEFYQLAAKEKETKVIYLFIRQVKDALGQQTIPSLEKIVEIDPKDYEYLNSLSFQFYKKGDYANALKVINQALGVKPLFALGLATRAEISFALEDYEDMYKCLDTAALCGFDISLCDARIFMKFGHSVRYKGIVQIVKAHRRER